MSLRPTLETRKAQPTMEGAGVHLHRAFGFQDPSELDPFLLFDDFCSDVPAHYLQGFPGIHIAELKPSPMCCRSPWNMVTVLATLVVWALAMCSG